MLISNHGWGLCESIAPFYFKSFTPTNMDTKNITNKLSQFHGTAEYHKHLFPGKSPIFITDGCKYIRDACNAYWLFDALLSYQSHKAIRDVNFQVWEFRQLKKDLSWVLTCRQDSDKKPIIAQFIEFSDFPLDCIKIWVIDKVALLPSEY